MSIYRGSLGRSYLCPRPSFWGGQRRSAPPHNSERGTPGRSMSFQTLPLVDWLCRSALVPPKALAGVLRDSASPRPLSPFLSPLLLRNGAAQYEDARTVNAAEVIEIATRYRTVSLGVRRSDSRRALLLTGGLLVRIQPEEPTRCASWHPRLSPGFERLALLVVLGTNPA